MAEGQLYCEHNKQQSESSSQDRLGQVLRPHAAEPTAKRKPT
jgi:hypothetical protein